jgi:hypothetical protein
MQKVEWLHTKRLGGLKILTLTQSAVPNNPHNSVKILQHCSATQWNVMVLDGK